MNIVPFSLCGYKWLEAPSHLPKLEERRPHLRNHAVIPFQYLDPESDKKAPRDSGGVLKRFEATPS